MREPVRQEPISTLMSGAKMLLECLVREGVDCIFGYPGGVTLPFYDALYDHHIRHVLVRHEENAGLRRRRIRARHRQGRASAAPPPAPAPPTSSPDWSTP